ncbi:MAG: hypothetical protein JXB34_05590 [Bacteroidales bacterium]|nr:hypothetical protein [Bacteroidales bacterium]
MKSTEIKQNRPLLIGETLLNKSQLEVSGQIIELGGENYYKIANYDKMQPFFISIVSDSDHWMFLSSNGGLTCGRKNPENALFPYYTDDKIHDSVETTGPKTIIIVTTNEKSYLWEPFSEKYAGSYRTERNLYKSIYGNKIVFEEINHSLKVRYTYSWKNSNLFGFVKESEISATETLKNTSIELLDGLRNLLPYGVNRNLQATMSTLVDGYKKCELADDVNLGIYTLSSILTDRAEPSESLKASVVWTKGLKNCKVLLSNNQIANFEAGIPVQSEKVIKGKRGAFFVNSSFELTDNAPVKWIVVSDVSQGPSDVPLLIKKLKSDKIMDEVDADIALGTENLKALVASADGFQHTGDILSSTRHFSNVLFNIMRGGIFSDGYLIFKDDFILFIDKWNKQVCEKHKAFLHSLGEKEYYPELLFKAASLNDPDLERLVREYLPLTFSRRHGDPSRPWNLFSIDIKKDDGSKKLYYQGNWRDIFQNWEALSMTYPEFIESFIAKFVNASTADGYNPYRITKDGIDWEILDPEDPWSNIGYWGDHQVIYLLKLFELSHKYHPGRLEEFLTKEIFVYANVPYRIKDYNDLIKKPQDSIEYAPEVEDLVSRLVATIGSDGKLIASKGDGPYKANLTEKILVSVLAKFSNFVPGGGIWMNTQRPEWNDANNALVGYGLSMVTLYYLRRMQSFLLDLFNASQVKTIKLSGEVAEMLNLINNSFERFKPLLKGEITDQQRKHILDDLGSIGAKYRKKIYTEGFTGWKADISVDTLKSFIKLSLEYLDHSIEANLRPDGLYNAYNLVRFEDGACHVENLYEMLEGQVAILSSGYLNGEKALNLLDSLRKSSMYRADQNSYMLYPDRELKGFLEKNLVAAEKIKGIDFLSKELESGNRRFVEKDINGNIHFNGRFRNAEEMRADLSKVSGLSAMETDKICSLFIETFNHRQFTGRSGTFFKYEGLGCIYWHMVSKLLVAVQEIYFNAIADGCNKKTLAALHGHYYAVRAGLGITKSPVEYGAFPTDPYSHTPGFAGVQQPGMTGQVKEDIITRYGELGVFIEKGEIHFSPVLLKAEEFVSEKCMFEPLGKNGNISVACEKGSLAFTLCEIPVIYRKSAKTQLDIEFTDGTQLNFSKIYINIDLSREIFERRSNISKIIVHFDENSLTA